MSVPVTERPTVASAVLPEKKIHRFRLLGWLGSLLLVVAVLAPLVISLTKLFFPDGTLKLSAFGVLLGEPWLATMLRDTLVAVGFGVLTALVLGALFAWLNERTDAHLGWFGSIMPLLPLFVPPLASAVGWVLLGTPGPGVLNTAAREGGRLFGLEVGLQGPVNIFTWPGMVFMFAINLLPHVYLVVSSALKNLDPALEEASRLNGAGPLKTLLRVTLPAVKPAIISGALLAMAAGFALFSVPLLIGSPAGIDNLIVRVVHMTTNEYPPALDEASVLGLVVVFFIGSSWLLQRRVNKLARHATIGGKSTSPSRVKLGWLKWPARVVILGYLACTALLPMIALVVVSLQSFWSGQLDAKNFSFANFERLFSPTSSTVHALQNSVILGVMTAFIAIGLASLIAYYGERNPRSFLGRSADAVAKLPAALSHVVIAVALLVTLAGPPFSLQGTTALLLVGYVIMYLPQASVNVNAALSQVGRTLSEASLLSGATEGRTFTKIVVPLMGPGLLSGWILVFVLAVGDLTASAMLASPGTPVVGFVMLDLATSGSFGVVAALGVTITLITSTVGCVALYLGQSSGRSRATRIRQKPKRSKA